MSAYYNENDPKAAAWLRELIQEGLIAQGEVDERSIADVQAVDLVGFTQCHFFAGIAGWSYALRLSGWSDSEPVWTGSCPCQPFSAAGQQKGTADERHLWPEFFRLISECRPATVFGEQVASKLGREWLSGVRTDLEALGYGVGAVDLCAAGVGAPHIRQRLYWVADSERDARGPGRVADESAESSGAAGAGSHAESGRCSVPGRMEKSEHGGCQVGESEWPRTGSTLPSGAWSDYELLSCIDGKTRRTGPGIFPLAHGVPGRVALLRGAGNAIVPQVAEAFIRAYIESRQELAA